MARKNLQNSVKCHFLLVNKNLFFIVLSGSNSKKMHNSAILQTVNKYIHVSGFTVDKEELELQLQSHPNFPNLISVSDVFHHFSLPHAALKVEKDEKILKELPDHFLAHAEVQSQAQLVLVSRQKNNLKLFLDKSDNQLVSTDDFLNMWTGIIITFTEVPIRKTFRNFKRIFSFENVISLLLLIFVPGVFFLSGPDGFQSFFFGFSMLGLWISSLIVRHEMGLNSINVNETGIVMPIALSVINPWRTQVV